jgi:hypothetical protein
MRQFLRSVLILSLLALVSAPAFAVGPCFSTCTCTSKCAARCVGPDGIAMTCGFYGICMGSCLKRDGIVQLAGPIQEANIDEILRFRTGMGESETCSESSPSR